MARHSGKNLKVISGGDTIDGTVGFDFEETSGDADLTASGDAWDTHESTRLSWSGTINMKADHAAVANQTLRAGDSIDVGGYTEGDGVGKTYLSGTCTIMSHKVGATFDGEATREYSIKGNGPLAIEVVA